ncbi:zinc ribbon domain-containing protein [Streptomyces sp. NPDC088124]|uniref:NADase-type glycan-binding domain-containing protein n=1 Tax=Streptomyces sp. NPDC088124 TaxID=3154654 RepID=UPI003423AE5E
MTSQTSSSPASSPPPSQASDTSGRRASNCAECGTRPEPGQSFCDGCGAVLNWSPEPPSSSSASSSPASSPASAASAPGGTPDTGGTGPTGGTAPAAGPGGTAPAANTPAPRPHADPVTPDDEDTTPTLRNRQAQAAEPRDAAPANPYASAPPTHVVTPSHSSASAAEEAERARALLVPVADPEGRPATTPDVAPVLPGRPAAARPRVQSPGAEPADETGPPCPWCSTGNRPDRHFCRRCAMALTDRTGIPDAPRPWWRRMWWGAGERPAPWAGDRPRLRRGISGIFSWIALALALVLVVFAAFNVDNAWNAARDHFAKRAQVNPDKMTASRSFKNHEPKAAFDKVSNSWWGPGIDQSAEGEWIQAEFQQPIRILDVIITPGISVRASDLTEAAMPHRMDAVITAADGTKTTRQITLDQGSGPQRRKFRVGEVSSVRFIIRSAYGAGPEKQVSIAEIEFFGRSRANDG